MPQTREALLRAVSKVLRTRSNDERTEAVAAAVSALEAYAVSPDEVLHDLPEVDRVAEATRRQLGDRRGPIERFTDAELRDLNELLPWAAMTVDRQGRILGAAYSARKRAGVHTLADHRHVEFDRAFPLQGRHVAEFGCFEGIHTLSLQLLGATVTAIDGRVENVLKTMARLWAYGQTANTLLWDFEREAPSDLPAAWDVLHHVGVLYHLSNPVEHLASVLPRTRSAVLLDTHVARDEADAASVYSVGGRAFAYRRKEEPNADISPFAGLRDHAKYLLVDDLVGLLREEGFGDTRVVSDRMERNGRRVTIWAFR